MRFTVNVCIDNCLEEDNDVYDRHVHDPRCFSQCAACIYVVIWVGFKKRTFSKYGAVYIQPFLPSYSPPQCKVLTKVRIIKKVNKIPL